MILALVFVTVFMCSISILNFAYSEKEMIRMRLQVVQSMGKNTQDRNYFNQDLKEPIVARIFKPSLDQLKNIFMKITPVRMKEDLEKKLVLAGFPMNLDIKGWIFFRTSISIIIPGLAFSIIYMLNKDWSFGLLIFLLFFGIAFLFPNIMLSQSIKQRQNEIRVSLPDVIDLLTVSVEAGLSFDSALTKVVVKMKGALPKEFSKALNEISVGRSRADALKDVGQRTGVKDLEAFISSIIQADKLGVGIGNVLRIQSVQMREKRRQRAQESAMKAPVKMLFPLVIFIFPTLFIILLGPAVLILIEMFTT